MFQKISVAKAAALSRQPFQSQHSTNNFWVTLMHFRQGCPEVYQSTSCCLLYEEDPNERAEC